MPLIATAVESVNTAVETAQQSSLDGVPTLQTTLQSVATVDGLKGASTVVNSHTQKRFSTVQEWVKLVKRTWSRELMDCFPESERGEAMDGLEGYVDFAKDIKNE